MRWITSDPLNRSRFPVEPWRFVELEPSLDDLGVTETLFAVGNGYLGMRGNPEEGRKSYAHGTFINGFHETWPIKHAEEAFGFARTGQTIVNVPDAKLIKIYVDDEPLTLGISDLDSYERAIDFRTGCLTRDIVWRTPAGKRVQLRSRRMVSFTDRHLALFEIELTMLEGDAPVVLSSQLVNRQDGFDDYRRSDDEGFDPRRAGQFNGRVLQPRHQWEEEQRIALGYETTESGMTLCVAADHQLDTSNPFEVYSRVEEDQAKQVYRIDARAGVPVVIRLEEPTPGGRRYRLNVDLQRDFALNQPLSAFALAVIETLDITSLDYALDVVSVIEATLEDPRVLLLAQQFKARGEAMAEMKADGWDYEERMEALEEVTWPRPLAEHLEAAHLEYSALHPWLAETPVSPKSVVRDMYLRGMTFGEYVAHYKLQRTEGLLLRYLTDAYRALRQTVPESLRSEELNDLIDWLGASTRLVDSSLLDEWNELADLAGVAVEQRAEAVAPARPVTGNERAFTVMVRNAMWRRVELCADDDVDALAALTSGDPMTRQRWDDALGEYWDEHEDIGVGQDARGPAFFHVETRRGGRSWEVRQILDDPAGNRDWSILATVDLDECDEAGQLVLRTLDLSRLDG